MYDVYTLQAWIQAIYNADSATRGARLWMDSYAYTANFGAFSGITGQAAVSNIAINAISDFFVTRISYQAGLSAAFNVSTMPVVQARLQITDTGSQNSFFNAPIALENICSHQYPARFLPMPRYVSANSALSLALTGIGTAADSFTYVDVVLEGIRVRRFSNGVFDSSAVRVQ